MEIIRRFFTYNNEEKRITYEYLERICQPKGNGQIRFGLHTLSLCERKNVKKRTEDEEMFIMTLTSAPGIVGLEELMFYLLPKRC